MIKRRPYYFLLFLLFALAFAGCGDKVNKRYTLWRNDKIPYGTWYAYSHLHHLFTNSEIQSFNKSPLEFYSAEGAAAYISVGTTVKPSENELIALLNRAYGGNHIFISALEIGDNLLDSFKLKVSGTSHYYRDSLTVSLYDQETGDSIPFSYPGVPFGGYFSEMDSSITSILGKDKSGRANFVKFTYETGGAVYLHLAPTAFTNFFLLHKKNKQYYDIALSAIPDSVKTVKWDDYFRHHINGSDNSERSAFSKLREILKNDVLRWAFWLTILLFAIIYLFESKRKQRIVPIVRKLNNTSLDFVKTIGRLYFQRKDNRNLASKMATHFLGHVRSRYNLPTSQLTEEFERKLAFKSGYSHEVISEIVGYIRQIENKPSVSDNELLAFNNKIEKFYKQT